MAQRRRRSLIGGADKTEGADGPETGASDEGHEPAGSSPAAEPAAEAPAEEPAEEPAADAWSAAPPDDPWAAPAPDPWAADVPEPAPSTDPWAPAPPAEPSSGGYEVSEERRSVGGYQSTAKNLADTTDSGWSNNAFREGGQPSLPPGWDSPSPSSSSGPVRPTSPFTSKADFFSDEPPTEEQPSAVYENRGMPQSAPMNVPDSGPVPATARKSFGGAPAGDPYVTTGAPVVGAAGSGKSFGAAPAAASSNRPSYLPPETPKKAPPRASPAPAPARGSTTVGDDDEDKPAGPPTMMLAAGFIVIVMGIVVLGLVVMIATGVFTTEVAPPPPPAVVVLPPPPPVPVTGDTDVPAVAVDPVVPPVAVEAVKVPPPETKAVAKVPPPDKPKDTKKVNKTPAGAKGTLKIRSNRRVLVKVNGQPKDYTPLDLPADAGAYTITAALPGKPDSEQSFKVDLKSGVTEAVNFSF